MTRLLICLSICLLLAPDRYREPEPVPSASANGASEEEGPFAFVPDDGSPLPDEATLIALARTDPCAFLEHCIRRCQREVHGVRFVLRKHERTQGQQRNPEVIDVDYRVQPFNVLFHWRSGGTLATAVLYAPDERPGKLLVRPFLGGWVGNVTLDLNGDDAKRSGRYSLEEFGFEMAMRRTLSSWRKARKENALHIEFAGLREIDGRDCFVLHRINYARPEEADGVRDLTIHIDRATWLQTGSILKNGAGEVLGEYHFDQLQINPKFQPERFTPKGLQAPPPGGI